MLAVQGMKKMKILKPGTLNPKVIRIVFESGNSVTVGCHVWISGPVGRISTYEAKGGRLQAVGEYCGVAWVHELEVKAEG